MVVPRLRLQAGLPACAKRYWETRSPVCGSWRHIIVSHWPNFVAWDTFNPFLWHLDEGTVSHSLFLGQGRRPSPILPGALRPQLVTSHAAPSASHLPGSGAFLEMTDTELPTVVLKGILNQAKQQVILLQHVGKTGIMSQKVCPDR